MTTLIYTAILFLLVVTCETKPIDDYSDFLSSSDRSSESVANGPPKNTFYSSLFNKFFKVEIMPDTNVTIFYPFEGSGMKQKFYGCHYTYENSSDGWRMTLTDGYKYIIADSKGFYDEKIINGIKGDDVSLSIPNAKFIYETFRVK